MRAKPSFVVDACCEKASVPPQTGQPTWNALASFNFSPYRSNTPEEIAAFTPSTRVSERQQVDDQRCSVVFLFAARGAAELFLPLQQLSLSAPLSSSAIRRQRSLCRASRGRRASLAAPVTPTMPD
jgi:hypothetical protein